MVAVPKVGNEVYRAFPLGVLGGSIKYTITVRGLNIAVVEVIGQVDLARETNVDIGAKDVIVSEVRLRSVPIWYSCGRIKLLRIVRD